MNKDHVPETWTESIDDDTGQPRWDHVNKDVFVRAELDEESSYEVIAYPRGEDSDSTRLLGPADDIEAARDFAVAYITGRDDEIHDRTSELVGDEWGIDL